MAQVTLLKQQKVAALADAQARFAAAGPYAVQAKPHGHGDLHALLHASGIAARWQLTLTLTLTLNPNPSPNPNPKKEGRSALMFGAKYGQVTASQP